VDRLGRAAVDVLSREGSRPTIRRWLRRGSRSGNGLHIFLVQGTSGRRGVLAAPGLDPGPVVRLERSGGAGGRPSCAISLCLSPTSPNWPARSPPRCWAGIRRRASAVPHRQGIHERLCSALGAQSDSEIVESSSSSTPERWFGPAWGMPPTPRSRPDGTVSPPAAAEAPAVGRRNAVLNPLSTGHQRASR